MRLTPLRYLSLTPNPVLIGVALCCAWIGALGGSLAVGRPLLPGTGMWVQAGLAGLVLVLHLREPLLSPQDGFWAFGSCGAFCLFWEIVPAHWPVASPRVASLLAAIVFGSWALLLFQAYRDTLIRQTLARSVWKPQTTARTRQTLSAPNQRPSDN